MKYFILLFFTIFPTLSYSAERLTDRYGRTIGTVSTQQHIQTIRDRQGRITGRYNSKNNKTYDRYGRIIGTGNQLSSTLPNRK